MKWPFNFETEEARLLAFLAVVIFGGFTVIVCTGVICTAVVEAIK